jgi:HAD superfamily hydrolase (TIGR01662 family)
MTSKKIEVLLFDLGGTLMFEKDPWPPIFARAEAALRQELAATGLHLDAQAYGRSPTFLDYYNERRALRADTAEEPSAELLGSLLRDRQGGTAAVPDIRRALRAMYTVTQANWLPEADALPTLMTLKSRGYRLGLVSNAADDANTQTLIDKGGLRELVECILVSAVCGVRKPDPRIFQLALDHFGIQPAQAAMVGDALEADVLGANQIGMLSIWITRRAAPNAGDLARIRPAAQVDALAEIPALLEGLGSPPAE